MAGRYNFIIEQGETLRRSFVWKAGKPLTPVNLTGTTPHMVMRPHRQDPIVLDAYLTLRPTDGAVDLVVPPAVTSTWNFSSSSYDVEVAGGDTTRLLKGVATLSREQPNA